MPQCGIGCQRLARGRPTMPQHHNGVAVRLTQIQIDVLLDPAPARPHRAAKTAKCWQHCTLNHIETFDLEDARWSIKASPEARWIIP